MSKSTVEQKLTKAQDVLKKIWRALETHPDPQLTRLAREAKSAAEDVDSAHKELHTYWEE